jgi:hypothetical protein
MMLGYEQTHIDVDPRFLATRFDREPFGFTHSLCDLDLLKISELQRLAARYTEHDYFVAAGATTAAMPFYSVRHSDCTPVQAIERLAAGGQRILLKRPEKYDVRFRDLLATSFAQIIERRNGLDGKIVRLDSSILISSAATITPFHYDPEISFFCQIAGDKFYHIYSPCALDERELERFYVAGIVNIAQVPLAGRDPALEHVFALRPGMGMHQPRNAPHWVQTSDTLSISYVISRDRPYPRIQSLCASRRLDTQAPPSAAGVRCVQGQDDGVRDSGAQSRRRGAAAHNSKIKQASICSTPAPRFSFRRGVSYAVSGASSRSREPLSPAAVCKASALSVFSHGRSRSGRPKWPYAAVCK